MTGGLRYADASALVKLVVPEAETAALRATVQQSGRLATSAVGAVEFIRVARRLEGEAGALEAGRLLSQLDVVELSEAVQRLAGDLPPVNLRGIDAIHLATALSLGAITRDFYCYDRRLCEAATVAGLNVLSPGS